MKWEPWMARDERTPEQKRRDQLRSLEHEKIEVTKRLAKILADIERLEQS